MEYLLSAPPVSQCVHVCVGMRVVIRRSQYTRCCPLFTQPWIGSTLTMRTICSWPHHTHTHMYMKRTHPHSSNLTRTHIYTLKVNLHFCCDKIPFITMYTTKYRHLVKKKLWSCMSTHGLLICCVDWYLNKLCIRFRSIEAFQNSSICTCNDYRTNFILFIPNIHTDRA